MQAKVYGSIPIQPNCTNHAQKRTGTAVRTVKRPPSGEGIRISGKRQLTGNLTIKLTNYHRWAPKSYAGDIEMHSAVMATYYHVTATGDRPNPSLCQWRRLVLQTQFCCSKSPHQNEITRFLTMSAKQCCSTA